VALWQKHVGGTRRAGGNTGGACGRLLYSRAKYYYLYLLLVWKSWVLKENEIYFKHALMWISCQCTICIKYLSLILIIFIEQNFY
jgi:hypothetical protein